MSQFAEFRRVLNATSQPIWIYGKDSNWLNLTAAGIQDDLAEIAAAMLEPDLLNELCTHATKLNQNVEEFHILQAGNPRQALALGKNFAAHAREFGAEPPSELVWFNKLPSTLSAHQSEICIPEWLTTRVDHEAEMVCLVGAELFQASSNEAADAIAGYTLGNDITARKLQGEDRERQWPWLRCKNLHGFGPFGPAWVAANEISNFAEIEIACFVNGEQKQRAKLGDMIWQPAQALAELSRWTKLMPGDMVFLGTPAGVGPIKSGDQVEVHATGLSTLSNQVA